MKKIAIDIDGILCHDSPRWERSLQKPLPDLSLKLWQMKQDGHFIAIYTARAWEEYYYTKKWLNDNNLVHDILICGKFQYDIFIDDRAVNSWEQLEVCLNTK